MKKSLLNFLPSVLLLLPITTFAQIADRADGGAFQDLLINIVIFINDILIPFIIAIGFLFFVWGMFWYFILGGSDEEKKVKGRSLMINAVIGFIVIIVFFGVINLLSGSTGLQGETLKNVPRVTLP